jgi:3-deoxy-manno-octulosonate cytidylyltransferase (CMP-KDO synthetase)
MKVLGVIPARFASERFPGKPLTRIGKKTMVQWVYEAAKKCEKLDSVVVATDHEGIFDEVTSFGGEAVMTSESHQSGTDRCLEALKLMHKSYDAVVNIQGDEPLIPPQIISNVIDTLSKPEAQIATLAQAIKNEKDLHDPNRVKVVLGTKGQALYFSRQAIPFNRLDQSGQWTGQHTYYKHIGIYGYLTEVLDKIASLEPTPLEKTEALEQLRWLENGLSIHCGITNLESPSVDTPEDLKMILPLFD